ncbi:MAG TPA: hypothetical protein VFG44_02235 [Burkholderiales bacterium]|jgi:hypothetical protein|nr:hypothetical protein [Burkholderiales bacterium]
MLPHDSIDAAATGMARRLRALNSGSLRKTAVSPLRFKRLIAHHFFAIDLSSNAALCTIPVFFGMDGVSIAYG